MKINAYSIFDIKSLVYSNPFYAPTHGAAMRIVQDTASDLNTSLGRHPADFIVYCVGFFDTATGILEHLEHREHVIDVAALVHLNKPAMPLFDKKPEVRVAYGPNSESDIDMTLKGGN